MDKWPLGVFASIDAGLGVKLEIIVPEDLVRASKASISPPISPMRFPPGIGEAPRICPMRKEGIWDMLIGPLLLPSLTNLPFKAPPSVAPIRSPKSV